MLLLGEGCFPLDLLEIESLALSKVWLTEALVVLDRPRFAEVVHVQLTDEAAEVAMFEVLRQNFVTKLIHVLDNKPRAVLIPAHNIVILRVVNKVVGLCQEQW